MHSFKYTSPATIEELIDQLADHPEGSKLMAGGTDLIVQMRAGVNCKNLYENTRIATAYPALIDAARLIGGIQIQGRASIGGNIGLTFSNMFSNCLFISRMKGFYSLKRAGINPALLMKQLTAVPLTFGEFGQKSC